MKCRICGNTDNNREYTAIEMMFGFKDKFLYFQCAKCECLQIAEFPADMARYYPADYYSFANSPTAAYENKLKASLHRLITKYAVLSEGILGRILYQKFPAPTLRLLNELAPNRESKILDVGSGAGNLLYALQEIGFSNLLGIDPYISADTTYTNGLKIKKMPISDVTENWDIIMFHHSFEHLTNQLETLTQAANLLSPQGTCLIRIPTVSSYAWEKYGVNWVQLDAPRHFFLHSENSLKHLAEQAGLTVKKVIYDSTEFQFWGSEQYLQGIALQSDASYVKNPDKSIFTPKQITEFRRQAKKLNEANRGDAAAFFLQKK